MKIWLPEELEFMRNGKLPHKKTEEKMDGKTVVISGGTSGVGLETVKQLAKGNAHIVMLARNEEKAKKIKEEIQESYKVKIDILLADFSKLNDVRKVAKEILEKYNKIDVLINSVGIHNTKKKINEDGIEMVFCVNHISVFLLTKLLLDRLKESAPSRIIQINSEGHRFNGLRVKDYNFRRRIYTGLRGYGQAKCAQLYTVWELADQLKGTGVTINAVHPGEVRTNIGSNNGFLYRWFLNNVTWHFLKDPVISGESIYYHAASSEMKEVTGKFFNLTTQEKPAWHALKREKKGMPVYNLSMKLSGLTD